MPFVSPMLATAAPREPIRPGEWVAEEKFDGHRIVVSIGNEPHTTLFEDDGGPKIMAWSRDGKVRKLPKHLVDALRCLPEKTVFDGELVVPGQKSWAVTELVQSASLVYTIFDVLMIAGEDITHLPYSDRRHIIEQLPSCLEAGGDYDPFDSGSELAIAPQYPINTQEELDRLAAIVWMRGGEGLIVKRLSSAYFPGKRSRDWVKVKQLRSATMTIIGFRAGRLGPHSVVLLRDDDGNETAVKVLNVEEWQRCERDHEILVGRRLVVAYQERTPDGSYRHPRWDHWETVGTGEN